MKEAYNYLQSELHAKAQNQATLGLWVATFFFSWEVWDFGYSWQDLPTSLSVKWKGRSPISTRTTAHVATSTEQTKGPWSLALARALLIACRPAALSLAGCCNFFLFYFVPERNSSKEGFLLEVRLFNSLDPQNFLSKMSYQTFGHIHKVLNKVYLQNILYEWIVNREYNEHI